MAEETFMMAVKKNNTSLSQDKRANGILEVILSFARLDFSKKVTLSKNDDVLDGIGAGVNMLGEELKHSALSLKEKEHLLKEIHHRVKNNLQIVSSLLNLQSDSIVDEKYLALMKESQNRINSMALVHEMLYKSKDLSKIEIGEYIMLLSSSINTSYSLPDKEVRFEYNIQPAVFLEIDMMIPIGLIINEILSNSFKYAFTSKKKGLITINLKTDRKKLNLLVYDNGTGLKKKFDIKKQGSLGMQLIQLLSEQIDAEMKISSNAGVRYDLSFPLR